MLRGVDTQVRRIRRQVFTEVAKVGFRANAETLQQDMEEIPYRLIEEGMHCRDSIYRARAVIREQLRLAMGLSLRPENRAVHLTAGMDASNISEKYYEPPLIQVVPSACMACEEQGYEVSNLCKGCLAHPCMEVCPKGAVSMVQDKAFIDPKQCVCCGRCRLACPYDAIAKKERPCQRACGVGAIGSDNYGRAKIQNEKCVSCGMCMVSCPFGTISDKSQIFQLARVLSEGKEIIAELAPAYVGQFGAEVTAGQLKSGLYQLGFDKVYEVALGADSSAVAEAKQYITKVVTGELPFLLTSCCPSWAMLARNYFPDLIREVSGELTPMAATAHMIKKKHPGARVVFIGPCAAKKLEAMQNDIRSDVDFVITFEELEAMFAAKKIVLQEYQEQKEEAKGYEATGAGRGYGVAGGVAKAITACIKAYYPGIEPKVECAEGLAQCRKVLSLARAGKKEGYLIEGMGCPGGCVAGAGTNLSVEMAKQQVKRFAEASAKLLPPER